MNAKFCFLEGQSSLQARRRRPRRRVREPPDTRRRHPPGGACPRRCLPSSTRPPRSNLCCPRPGRRRRRQQGGPLSGGRGHVDLALLRLPVRRRAAERVAATALVQTEDALVRASYQHKVKFLLRIWN